MLDLYEHWQAFYDIIDGATTIPVFHVFSGDYQTNDPVDLPFIVYREDVFRAPYGAPADGTNKVLRSNYVISVFTRDMREGLDALSDIINAFEAAGHFMTDDGYRTTNVEPLNITTLWEKDGKNYGLHLRVQWERSL